MGTNKSVQLSATVKPDNTAYKDVMWESSNESIATVDSKGKVTGKRQVLAKSMLLLRIISMTTAR